MSLYLFCGDEDGSGFKTKAKMNCQDESVACELWCKKFEEDGGNTLIYGETKKTAKIRCGRHIDALATA